MKRILLTTITFISLAFSTLAQSESQTAESFFFAIRNDVFSLFELQIADQADKKTMEAKFRTLINTINSTGMDKAKLQYYYYTEEKLHGLNSSVLVILYDYDGKRWDDLIILIDNTTYQIIDIGTPEKAFLRNASVVGKNRGNLPLVGKIFYPNLPNRHEAMEAAKKLIALANADKLEEIIPLIAYRGIDDPNRKNLSGPLNPKIAQDRAKASAYLSDIRGTFEGPESVTLLGRFEINPNDGSCYFRLRCEGNKNTGDFRLILLKGKYLLSEFR